MTEQIAKMMKNLGISEAEAIELVEYDKKVDKGLKTEYDLSKEQEKVAKKFANVTEHKTSTAKTPRKVKENPEKETFIANLCKILSESEDFQCENVEITNKSREICFKIGENAYKLTLVASRKAKNE